MGKEVRPCILPPRRKSTGKSDVPVLVRLIGNTFTGPLNDRLDRYVSKSKFPAETVDGHFRIAQQGSDLYFYFSVNGEAETFILNDWRKIHSDERDISQIRALPWKVFQKMFDVLDKSRTAWLRDNYDPSVTVYPSHMHPARRGAYDFTYFPTFYFLVLPAWKHGKEVYKRNRRYSTWQQTVMREVENKLAEQPASDELISKSDPALLNQLVNRLEKPRSVDDTISSQAQLKDRRIPATPEELALDHAAHLCGVPLYEYTTRHLKKLKSKQASTKGTSMRVREFQQSESEDNE